MRGFRELGAALLLAAAWMTVGHESLAGGFGTNKVRDRAFDWQVLTTEHFEVHYYPGVEDAAHEACETAEEYWQKLAESFRLMHMPQRRVPVFIYATSADFQQTNIIPEVLGEGVGGFTEVFKTRVVVPAVASAEERRHVLTHELTHAMQYFVLYGEGLRSYTLYKSVLIPLWFIEGMAEYFSQPTGPEGDMVLRDAVISERLPSLFMLHSFNHLEPHDAYLGYKAGQSALTFMADKYGEDKIPAILKSVEEAKTFSVVFKEKTGESLEEFDRKWRNHLKEVFWSQVRGKKEAEEYGTPIFRMRPDLTGISSGPAQSPVDDSIIFLSDRGGARDLYLVRKGGDPKRVLSAERFDHILGSPPDWSPDGKSVVLTAARGSHTVISIVRMPDGKILAEHEFPFRDVSTPRFSPDGTRIAFAAANGRSTELFIASLKDWTCRQITFGNDAARCPAFTPDGKKLVYVCNVGGAQVLNIIDDLEKEEPGSRRLGGVKPIQGNHPDVSPDGKWVLYDNPENGILNLWTAGLDGNDVRKLTDVRTGIFSGRWARDGRRVLAATMENGSQNIYLLNDVMPSVYSLPAGTPASSSATGKQGRKSGSKTGNGGKLPPIPASRLAPPRKEYSQGFSSAGAVGGKREWISLDSVLFPAAPAHATEAPPLSATSLAASGTARPWAISAMLTGPTIKVSWSPPVSVAAVSNYRVFRSTTARYPGAPQATVRGSSSSWQDSEWTYDRTYYYRVRALDARGGVVATGETSIETRLEVWPARPYRFSLDEKLVDLLVLVGSLQIGAGASFAGYGNIQMSDLLGNNRLALEANAVPGWENTYSIGYEFAGWRPDIGVSFQAMEWSRYAIVEGTMSTESFRYPPIITGLQNAGVMVSYPFDTYDRIEMSGGIQQFTEVFADESTGEEIGEETSTLFPVSVALVRDTSRWHRLMPIGGSRIRLEASEALPVSRNSLYFTEYSGECQGYWGLLDDLSLATRWWGGLSTGRNSRFFYLGGRYSLRAFPSAKLNGNGAFLGNHELRYNVLSHLNVNLPLIGILLTDVQGVAFLDNAGLFDNGNKVTIDNFRPASVGAGLNFVGFIFQSSAVMFSLEVARRIDTNMSHPTVYGRLGPIF